MQQVEFGDALLITHAPPTGPLPENLRLEVTKEIESREAYSLYLQTKLTNSIFTKFALIIQWDGYVLNPSTWSEEFLEYDYIGAPWPQFVSPLSVGNGGFSLRSKRLLEVCAEPDFRATHPEDLSICHYNRAMLEQKYGIRFAPESVAARFSYERSKPTSATFGFHGVFNMLDIVEIREFTKLCGELETGLLGLRELCDLITAMLQRRSQGRGAMIAKLSFELLRSHGHRLATWRFIGRYMWKRMIAPKESIEV